MPRKKNDANNENKEKNLPVGDNAETDGQAASVKDEKETPKQPASSEDEKETSKQPSSSEDEKETPEQPLSSGDGTESTEQVLSSEEMSEILDKDAILDGEENMLYQVRTTCDVLAVRTEPNGDAPVILYIKESVGNKKSYTIIDERDGYGYIDAFGWIALAYTVRV